MKRMLKATTLVLLLASATTAQWQKKAYKEWSEKDALRSEQLALGPDSDLHRYI